MNENSAFDDEAAPPADSMQSPASSFPWPPAGNDSALSSLGRTWQESTFHPSRFFGAMPADARMGPAILYYLIIGIAVAAATLFWSQVLPQPAVDPEILNSPMGMFAAISPVIQFLLSPVIQLGALFVGAAITQAMLLMLITQRGPYARTVSVWCYAYSPMLFGIIPYIGTFVGTIWSIVVAIIGLREAHRTTTGRAAAAVLLPGCVIFILGMVIVMMFVAGAVMLTP